MTRRGTPFKPSKRSRNLWSSNKRSCKPLCKALWACKQRWHLSDPNLRLRDCPCGASRLPQMPSILIGRPRRFSKSGHQMHHLNQSPSPSGIQLTQSESHPCNALYKPMCSLQSLIRPVRINIKLKRSTLTLNDQSRESNLDIRVKASSE